MLLYYLKWFSKLASSRWSFTNWYSLDLWRNQVIRYQLPNDGLGYLITLQTYFIFNFLSAFLLHLWEVIYSCETISHFFLCTISSILYVWSKSFWSGSVPFCFQVIFRSWYWKAVGIIISNLGELADQNERNDIK